MADLDCTDGNASLPCDLKRAPKENSQRECVPGPYGTPIKGRTLIISIVYRLGAASCKALLQLSRHTQLHQVCCLKDLRIVSHCACPPPHAAFPAPHRPAAVNICACAGSIESVTYD